MGRGQSNIAHSSQAVGEGLWGRIEGSTEVWSELKGGFRQGEDGIMT